MDTNAAMDIFSFGGGVQSTASLVLAAQGKLECDTFVFANVGDNSENPATLDYMRDYARPFAERHNLNIVEVSYGKELYDHVMAANRTIDIPIRMANGAPGNRTCTFRWKINVVAKWLKTHIDKQEYGVGLGISIDEWHRMADSRIKGIANVYPLVDARITRMECHNIIANAGLPAPPKSSCYFCPFHRLAEWKEMARTKPDLFAKSVALEERLNVKRQEFGKDAVWLTSYGMPLKEVVQDNGQLSMFEDDSCESGYCMT